VVEKPLLSVNNIEVTYEHVIKVLKAVSLVVPEGGIIALLGANGAGKSTTLKAISNLLKAERGEVTKGTIEFDGMRIDLMEPAKVVKRGVIQVMEDRRLFEHLTVEKDLLTGAYTRRHQKAAVKQDLEMVYHYFPGLQGRRNTKTGYLSGGEKQMVAIGRALMARPKLMLLDEPSVGLAPLLIRHIFVIVGTLNREQKVTILLAEQNVAMALQIAGYGYVMENGRMVLDGDSQTLKDNEDIKEFYLGLTDIGKKSYRDVKRHKRRKRWLAS